MKLIREHAYLFIAVGLIALATACQQLGIPKPQSFRENLALGYATVTQILTTATTLLNAKKITADDAQHVQDQADNAKKGLDVARDLCKFDTKTGVCFGDIKAADAKREAVIAALKATQDYLKGKQ